MKFFKLRSDDNQDSQTQQGKIKWEFDFDEWEEADDYQHRKVNEYFVGIPNKKAHEFILAYRDFKEKLCTGVYESIEVWNDNYIVIRLSSLIEPEEDIPDIMECFDANFDEISKIFGTKNLTFKFEPFYH